MSVIQSLWMMDECPRVNGVIFGDDNIQCIEPYDIRSPPGVVTLDKGSFLMLEEPLPYYLVELIATCRVRDLSRGIVLIGGEGGMGDDGFVAVVDLSNQIRWIAFFDFSNPFVLVELRDDEAVAINNLDEVWHFPLDDPSRISVEVPG